MVPRKVPGKIVPGKKVPEKAFSAKGMTGKFTGGRWTVFFIDWPYPTTPHTHQKMLKADPTIPDTPNSGKRAFGYRFFRGPLFQGPFFTKTFFPEISFPGDLFLANFFPGFNVNIIRKKLNLLACSVREIIGR